MEKVLLLLAMKQVVVGDRSLDHVSVNIRKCWLVLYYN